MKTVFNGKLIFDSYLGSYSVKDGMMLTVEKFVKMLKEKEIYIVDVYWNPLMSSPEIYIEFKEDTPVGRASGMGENKE